MSFHYIQIDNEGFPTGESWLSGEIHVENNIRVEDDFSPTNKRYVNGEWVDYTPPEPEPWEKDLIDENEQAQLELQVGVQYMTDLLEMLVDS